MAVFRDSMRQYERFGTRTASGGIEIARTEQRVEELRRRTSSVVSWGATRPGPARRGSRGRRVRRGLPVRDRPVDQHRQCPGARAAAVLRRRSRLGAARARPASPGGHRLVGVLPARAATTGSWDTSRMPLTVAESTRHTGRRCSIATRCRSVSRWATNDRWQAAGSRSTHSNAAVPPFGSADTIGVRSALPRISVV